MDCILVVVDLFCKYAHFLGIKLPFTAKSPAGLHSKHHRYIEFSVGDKVYLKFRLYRQRSLFSMDIKLAPRSFGPFEIEA